MNDYSGITEDQCKDTALALVLVLLLLHASFEAEWVFIPSIIILVTVIIRPVLFKVPAALWFGFAHGLGIISTHLLLTVLFITLVIPVAFIRRITRADPMQGKSWKKDSNTVFTERNHTYTAEDLDNPY
ncbi:SxtJ family membrane protein [Thermodesulfobacteriota bacterium]